MATVTYAIEPASVSDNGGIETPPKAPPVKRGRGGGPGRKPMVFTPEELQERLERKRAVAAKFQRDKHRWLVSEVARLTPIEEEYKVLKREYTGLLETLAKISNAKNSSDGS